MLNDLLEFAGCDCGGVVTLEGDEACIQLRTLHTHSLGVCAGCKEDDSSVLQHARLLVTTIQSSSLFHPPHPSSHDLSHDLSHDPSHVSEVVLSVLDWTRDPAVVVYVLENRSSLEEALERGRSVEGDRDEGVPREGVKGGRQSERVLERLVQRAMEDSDPDILPMVSS